MKRLFVMLAVISIGILGLEARSIYGGMGFFMGGMRPYVVNDINTSLNNNGLPELNDSLISLGGGGYGIIDRFLIGGEGHGIVKKVTTSELYKTTFTGGYGVFDLGYVLTSSRKFLLYPMVGIGANVVDMQITQKETIDFDDVLNDPKRGIHLKQESMILDMSMNASIALWNHGGLMMTARVGYIMTPSVSEMDMNGIEVYNSPEIKMEGLYFSIGIGGGGFGR